MTRTRLNGITVLVKIVSVIGILLCGCSSPNRIADAGRFFDGLLVYYFNDPAKVMIGLEGDYDIVNVKGYKNQIRPFHKKSFLYDDFRTPLFRAKTNMGPFYECNASIGTKKDFTFYINSGFTEQVINTNKFYQRISDKKSKVVLESIIPLADYDVYLVATGSTKNNPNFTVDFLRQSIRDEYDMILASVIKDAAYLNHAPINPFEIANYYFDSSIQGNYLSPLKELRAILSINSSNWQLKDFTLQALATYSTFINDPELVQQFLRDRTSQHKSDSVTQPKKNAAYPNLKYLTAAPILQKEAVNHRVLMFNESHFQPMHRLAASKMLKSFYEAGYRYFALECLNFDDSINERGFPIQNTGFYAREFQMANLIRTALKIGFKLIPYDYGWSGNQQSSRELYQAINLYNNTLKVDPKARVVVLGGHSHTYENGEKFGKKMMATYFKEISGIDPFTINQTEYNFFGEIESAISNGVYVLEDPDSSTSGNDLYLTQKYDSSINEIFIGEEDNAGKEIDLPISTQVAEKTGDKALLIYLSNELRKDSTAVPCFAKRITSENHLELVIPHGEYVLYIRSEYGIVLHEMNFTVLQDSIKFR